MRAFPPREKYNSLAKRGRSAATQIAFHQLVKGDPRGLVGLLTFGKKRLPSRPPPIPPPLGEG